MTVGELKKKLEEFQDEAEVYIEGCDCEAPAVDVEVMLGDETSVLVTRR